MTAIKACFNCKICDNVFVEPVILPCGNSICQSHVTFEDIFTCQICGLEHPIPKEGFIANKLIKDLITTKIHDNLSEKNNQQILNSFSLLEKTIQEIEHLEKNPDDFISDFFAKLIHKIDLKREENKIDAEKHFQNDSSELNTLKDDQNLEKYRISSLSKFSSYFTINELKVFKENTKNKKELAISYLENIDRKKDECVDEVESLYTQLLDEMTEKRNNYMKFSDTKKLSESTKTKIEKIKQNLDEFNQNLKQIFFTDELYDSIKQKTNDDRILLNNAIRDFKSELLLEKGFELEKKEFEFPKFSKIFSRVTLKDKTLYFDFSSDDLMKKKRGTILISEKSVINGISFYTGLKLEKNNYLYACLYCSNDYEFSGIDIEYSFKINGFKENYYNYVFRHFGAGFKKLIKKQETIKGKIRLFTRIKIKNLSNRTSMEEKIERQLKLNINERRKPRVIKPKVMTLSEFNQIDSYDFCDDMYCKGHNDYAKL